jgi:hypothetical protein
MLSPRRAGLPQPWAAKLAGMAVALGLVAVLGDFYGRIITGAPELVSWMSSTLEQHQPRIARAKAGRF